MAPKRVVVPAGPSRPGVKSNLGKVAADQRNILKSMFPVEVDEAPAVVPPETGLARRRKPQRRVSSQGLVTGIKVNQGPI